MKKRIVSKLSFFETSDGRLWIRLDEAELHERARIKPVEHADQSDPERED